jgi:multiple sugar transport system ATP-binding protein
MRAELKRLQGELGVTTIYVTHDQIEAMTLAHRIAILNEGALAQVGSPRAVYEDPVNTFVAGFMGSPPMNLLHGEVAHGVFVHSQGRIPIANGALNRAAVLGIRPEACHISTPGEGNLTAEIFTTELVGDHALVITTVGEDRLAVKAPRAFAAPPGTRIGIRVAAAEVLLFDGKTGARL